MPSCLQPGLLTWEIKALIRSAQQEKPDRGMGPTNQIYVPPVVHGKLIQWAHSPKLKHAISFMQRLFGWPSLGQDV